MVAQGFALRCCHGSKLFEPYQFSQLPGQQGSEVFVRILDLEWAIRILHVQAGVKPSIMDVFFFRWLYAILRQ